MARLPGIIAVDLDGTVFSGDHKTVMDRTYQLLEKCVLDGTRLVPVTGRCEALIPFDRLPPVRYVITCNGGLITDRQTGEILRASYIPWQNVRAAWEAVRSLVRENDLVVELFEDRDAVLEACVCDQLPAYASRLPGFQLPYIMAERAKKVSSFDEYINADCTRVIKINFPGKCIGAYPQIAQQLREMGLFSVTSDGLNLEISDRGCNKGEALLWLANRLRVPSGDTLAFGDGNNDLSMLHGVGWGVAMGNAPDSIKATAPYRTAGNKENGIALFLEKMFPQLRA